MALQGVGSLERVTEMYDPLFDRRRAAGVVDWVSNKLPKRPESSSGESVPDKNVDGMSRVVSSANSGQSVVDNAAHIQESLRRTHALVESIAPGIEHRRRADTRCINYTPDGSQVKAIGEEELALLLCSPDVDHLLRAIVLRLRHWWWDAELICSILWRIFKGEITDPERPGRAPRSRAAECVGPRPPLGIRFHESVDCGGRQARLDYLAQCYPERFISGTSNSKHVSS